MEKNQFRRDPISGQWTIILTREYEIPDLLRTSIHTGKKDAQLQSKYASGNEAETPPEIFAIRDDNSQRNEAGWKVRVLPYRQPLLEIHGELNSRGVGLYDVLDGIGAHELVVESPQPNHDFHNMTPDELGDVLTTYRSRILDLKRDPRFRYIMIHKNYGEGDDDLAFHAHSHIIATPITPARVKAVLMNAMEHFRYKERCLFCDIIFQELNDNVRVIDQNDHFVALAPFASRVPFAVRILPKKHETFFEWNSEHTQLAELLQRTLVKLHQILDDPHYIMVLHTGPNMATGKRRGYWKTLERDYHWYIEITPRFQAYTNFEIGSGFYVNVISPERAAKILQTEKTDVGKPESKEG